MPALTLDNFPTKRSGDPLSADEINLLVAELRAVRRIVLGARGPGVAVAPDGLVIQPPAQPQIVYSGPAFWLTITGGAQPYTADGPIGPVVAWEKSDIATVPIGAVVLALPKPDGSGDFEFSFPAAPLVVVEP